MGCGGVVGVGGVRSSISSGSTMGAVALASLSGFLLIFTGCCGCPMIDMIN